MSTFTIQKSNNNTYKFIFLILNRILYKNKHILFDNNHIKFLFNNIYST